MYIVELHNGEIVTEIHGLRSKLKSGNVAKGINCIDSFSFSMLPNNPGFNIVFDFQTLVYVWNTNKNRYDFQGRVLCSAPAMDESGKITKDVTCESFFGYLCDSVQRYTEEQNWTVKGLLQHMIDCHNSQVEKYKQFTIGEVSEDLDPNDNLYLGIQRENTWKSIEEKLLKKIGGEIRFRVVDGVIYLDYLKKIGEIRTTPIKLSRNMKSIRKESDPSAYITRLIPLGAKIKKEVTNESGETETAETEERLTIADVNDGKDYIDDTIAIEVYGIHAGYLEFDDVTSSQILLTKARNWLAENNKVQVKYSITALDLSLLGLDIDDFNVHDYHPVVNPLLGIDDIARIIKKNIDICDEIKSTIEVGDNFKTLTEIQQEQLGKLEGILGDITRLEGTTNNLKDKVSSVTNKVNKFEGIDGIYFYVKYSPFENGHEMTDAPNDDTLYMGTCSTSEATAPTDYRKYTWVKVVGQDGIPGAPGDNGKTQYLHIKYSDDGKTFTGKNCLTTDIAEWESGMILPSGSIDTPIDTNYIYNIFLSFLHAISVKPQETYTISCGDENVSMVFTCYDADGNYTPGANISTDNQMSITIPDGVYYVRVMLYCSTYDFNAFAEGFASGEIVPVMRSPEGLGEKLGAWIGTLVDFNEEDSENFDDYTWKKFTEDVDEELNEIRKTIEERYTSVINTAEKIILSALESYVQTSNYEQFRKTVETQFEVMAGEIEMNFTTTTEQITNIDGVTQSKFNELYKFIKFSSDTAITIGSGNNAITLEIDNEKGIVFKKNGVQFGLWDGEDFYTGNIIIGVNERAQFGNFAFVPRTDGSLSFLKVGG